MSLDRKVIGYKTRTAIEPIYQYELVKNMTVEICDEVTNTNPTTTTTPPPIVGPAYVGLGRSICRQPYLYWYSYP